MNINRVLSMAEKGWSAVTLIALLIAISLSAGLGLVGVNYECCRWTLL